MHALQQHLSSFSFFLFSFSPSRSVAIALCFLVPLIFEGNFQDEIAAHCADIVFSALYSRPFPGTHILLPHPPRSVLVVVSYPLKLE